MALSVDLNNYSSNYSNVDRDDSAKKHVFSPDTLLFNIFRKPDGTGFCPCRIREPEGKGEIDVILQETIWNFKDVKTQCQRCLWHFQPHGYWNGSQFCIGWKYKWVCCLRVHFPEAAVVRAWLSAVCLIFLSLPSAPKSGQIIFTPLPMLSGETSTTRHLMVLLYIWKRERTFSSSSNYSLGIISTITGRFSPCI